MATKPFQFVVGQKFMNPAGNVREVTAVKGARVTYRLTYHDDINPTFEFTLISREMRKMIVRGEMFLQEA